MKHPLKITEFRFKMYPNDFNKVRTFYESVLKLRVIEEWDSSPSKKGVMFDAGVAVIELLMRTQQYQPIAGVDLSVEVPDIWSLYKEIKMEKYVVGELSKNSWGDTSLQIVDPEGLEITIFTRHDSA